MNDSFASVFDKAQWPSLWQAAMSQVSYKTKRYFINPDSYTHIKKGVGYRLACSEITVHLHNGVKIGSIHIKDNWLSHIEVDKSHRRRGIAAQLMKLAVESFGPFKIACVKESRFYEYSLTEEGAILVEACLKKGIIKGIQCFGPGCIPLSDEASGDPGLAVSSLSRYARENPSGILSIPLSL
jgi:GNAT superfamily N-acetyltransferase